MGQNALEFGNVNQQTLGALAAKPEPQAPVASKRKTLAYRALIVVSFLYYARPEDIIPGMSYVPVVKIAGAIAVLGLLSILGKRIARKFPPELKILFALFTWLVITIPFAWWRGGAFETVFQKFSKDVIVAVLVSLVVSRMDELRRLLFVQVASVATIAFASMALHPKARMGGVLGGIFDNPNDLSIAIALNLPLALAFLLLAKGALRKLFWSAAALTMLLGIVLTYSRSGFLALALCGSIAFWQFAIKGKRLYLVGVAVIVLVVLLVLAPLTGLKPNVWFARMATIVSEDMNNAESHDNGSKEARTEILHQSLGFMKTHPLFGVGPGNFAAVSGTWLVAHNTYTELGAEAGIPALFLFVLLLASTFKSLRRVSKSESYKVETEVQVFTGAMWASFGAYLVGAAFASTEYELFPYFMIGYIVALYQLACVLPRKEERIAENKPETKVVVNRLDGKTRKPALGTIQ